MRIGIDAREACSTEKTGKGMWVREVIRELQRRNIPLTLFLEEEQGPKGLRWHFAVAKKLKREKPVDLYLSPTSYIVPRLLGREFPCAVVIHDLIAFESEPHDRKAKCIERITLPKVLKTAKYIFTVSEATKRELLSRFPRTNREKITIVYEGPTVTERTTKNEQRKTSIPYILSIGTLCPRKNQLRLIEAFNMLPEDVRKNTKLILVGKRGWDDEEIVTLANSSANVEWRGYVSDEERELLLRDARVFAYPSLMEGFGLPLLDALALGIPTLTSDRSSMPEIAGNGALIVDPKNTEAIAAGLERLLTDEILRKELREIGRKRAEGFSWGKTVDLLLKGVESDEGVKV